MNVEMHIKNKFALEIDGNINISKVFYNAIHALAGGGFCLCRSRANVPNVLIINGELTLTW